MERFFRELSRYFGHGWRLSVLDRNIGRLIVEHKTFNLAGLMTENERGRQMFIQPDSTSAPYFLFVDGLKHDSIIRHHRYECGKWKAGRMVVQIRDDLFQLWIHSSRPLNSKEKRYWIEKLNSKSYENPDDCWGICPSFRQQIESDQNRRDAMAKLIWVDWMNQADIPFEKTNLFGR